VKTFFFFKERLLSLHKAIQFRRRSVIRDGTRLWCLESCPPLPKNIQYTRAFPNNEQVSDFRLNFSWGMSKMRYFNNKFSKIRCWWSEVAWFAQKWFFKWIMAKWNFKKSVLTSFQRRHCYYDIKNVTKLTSQDFSILGPSQSKFLATSVVLGDNTLATPLVCNPTSLDVWRQYRYRT